jgi:hypothetical protein
MGMRAVAVSVVALWSIVGCAEVPTKEGDAEVPELSADQKSLVLERAPSDIPNLRYIDFNSKAELLGYSITPANLAAPGSKLTLKLYWRSLSKIEEGYTLFTQLVTPGGKRFDVQATGALRQGGALSPSKWEPGKVYVDEAELSVPDDLEAASFSIVVGFKIAPVVADEPAEAERDDSNKARAKDEETREAAFSPVYLSVLSGAADGKYGGVVATLATGVTPGAKRARGAKDDKRGVKRPGAPGRPPVKSARPATPPSQPAQ